MKTYRLIASALLAALAFILQISNTFIGIPTGFGMTVDLAAVPALIALFVLGAEYAMMVLALLALIILGTSPTGYVGALMKLAATIPMVVVPYIIAREKSLLGDVAGTVIVVLAMLALFFVSTEFAKMDGLEMLAGLFPLAVVVAAGYLLARAGGRVNLGAPKLALLALALAALSRSAIMTFANLYFAGPVFFGISPDAFISMLDALFLPIFGSGMGWFVIFFWNVIQSVVEFAFAWIPAYHFGLVKRYSG
jgi:riboflavin transporter FmnP